MERLVVADKPYRQHRARQFPVLSSLLLALNGTDRVSFLASSEVTPKIEIYPANVESVVAKECTT
jgi:hypothetical protein